jgi:hypothetical protein
VKRRQFGLLSAVLQMTVLILAPTFPFASGSDAEFPYVTALRTEIFGGYADPEYPESPPLVTDYYEVYTTFKNPSAENRNLESVYYVLMIVDEFDYSASLEMNTYGNRTVAGFGVKDFRMTWIPKEPGDFTIKSFLISGLEHPQILSDVGILNVTVKEKIVVLGEGESDQRLLVDSIEQSKETVTVFSNYCEVNSYEPRYSANLNVGESFRVKAVDAYFLGIGDDGKAMFRYEANNDEDGCLI